MIFCSSRGSGGIGCQPSLISRIRQSTKRRTGGNVMSSQSESTLDRSDAIELGKLNVFSRGGSIVRTLAAPRQSDDIR